MPHWLAISSRENSEITDKKQIRSAPKRYINQISKTIPDNTLLVYVGQQIVGRDKPSRNRRRTSLPGDPDLPRIAVAIISSTVLQQHAAGGNRAPPPSLAPLRPLKHLLKLKVRELRERCI